MRSVSVASTHWLKRQKINRKTEKNFYVNNRKNTVSPTFNVACHQFAGSQSPSPTCWVPFVFFHFMWVRTVWNGWGARRHYHVFVDPKRVPKSFCEYPEQGFNKDFLAKTFLNALISEGFDNSRREVTPTRRKLEPAYLSPSALQPIYSQNIPFSTVDLSIGLVFTEE